MLHFDNPTHLPPEGSFLRSEGPHPLKISDLVWINARLRNFQGELGLRTGFAQSPRAGQSPQLYFHPFDLPSALERCLRDLNLVLKEAQDLQTLVHGLAYFWATFLFRIHPFADGNGRTAKFLSLWLLQAHNVTVPNFDLLAAYRCTDNLENDIDCLEKLFWLSLVDPTSKTRNEGALS
jgi:Fic family protein